MKSSFLPVVFGCFHYWVFYFLTLCYNLLIITCFYVCLLYQLLTFLLPIPRILVGIVAATQCILVEWMNINFPDNSSLKHSFSSIFTCCMIFSWVFLFSSHSFRFVLLLFRMYIFFFITLRWIVLYVLDCFSTDMTLILSMLLSATVLDRSPCSSLNRAPAQLLPPLKDMKVGCIITAVFHLIWASKFSSRLCGFTNDQLLMICQISVWLAR